MTWPAPTPLLTPLAAWFEAHRRVLPWRAQDLSTPHPDPWGVLCSELMLQQTQVATVIPYHTRWMQAFPTPRHLAEVPEETAMKHWEGLGYYRRARHLQATARRLEKEGWPRDLEGLQSLPGLGPYTAAAVGAIAFQWPEAALDGNAFRVFARLLALEGDPTRHSAPLRSWLKPALAALGPSRLTQAIMELGALVCTPSPDCETCPLERACEAHRLGLERQLPPPKPRPAIQEVNLHLLALTDGARWLLHPPRRTGLLSGLWHWPCIPGPTAEPGPALREATSYPGWTQVYTHRREHLTPWRLVLEAPLAAPSGLAWVGWTELASLPLGKRDQRLRDLLEGGTARSLGLEGPEPQALCAALWAGPPPEQGGG